MIKFWILGLLSVFLFVEAKADLVITELMQSNVSGVIDDLNNFPDSWVELYNSGENTENLADYHIGLKKKIDKAYQLPEMEVAPGDYIIVYCDKEEQGLHTSFRLESNKDGEIYLFKNGEQIQMVSHPAFPAPDIAYGLDSESGKWGYELTATPGAPNIPGLCESDHILGQPKFSVGGGVFNFPISLTLTLPSDVPESTEIRYSLDGSLPDKNSPLYNEAEPIEIDKSTNVRAVLLCEGWLSPFPSTQSYIFPDHEITLPIFSITTDNEYLTGHEMGIYTKPYAEWRRPANFEFFEHAGEEAVINQSGEFKISGNSSRQWELKSFALYANKRFGEKRFDYEFFPETRPGKTDFKSLLLRNAGNDFYETFMRDAIIQNTVGNAMNIDYQAGRPCVVFINGVYKGLLNIRERSNEDNIYTNYDGLEDIDMFENWSEFKEGNIDAMNEITKFVRESGHTYEEYDERIDIKEFMDVYLTNLYYNNTDFPGNNIIAWKPQDVGGTWRLILKDTDYGMGLKFDWGKSLPYDFEILNWVHDPGYVSDANTWGNMKRYTAPFVNMENFPTSREDYINRALIYMGDFLNSRTTVANIEDWYQKIKSEWPYHAQLIGDKNGMSPESLTENVEYMKEWIVNRDTFFPKHFADFYNLGELTYLEVEQPDSRVQIHYEMNDLPLTTGTFKGYFPKERNIKITASLDSIDCSISGWKVNIVKENIKNSVKSEEDGYDNEEITFLRTDTFEFSCPAYATYVSVMPILDTSHLVEDISMFITAGDNFIPVEGIRVNLEHNGLIETSITDEEGKIIFEAKEWGDYKIEIDDPSFLFELYSHDLILNGGINESITINLTERLVQPSKIFYHITKKESGLYDVDLSWEMEGYGIMDQFFGYCYHVLVNGVEIARTPKTSYRLEDMEAADIVVSVYGESLFGRVTNDIGAEIEVESFKSTGVSIIDDEKMLSGKYYNLNGLEVSPENLAPGIYIHVDPDGKTTKIMKR